MIHNPLDFRDRLPERFVGCEELKLDPADLGIRGSGSFHDGDVSVESRDQSFQLGRDRAIREALVLQPVQHTTETQADLLPVRQRRLQSLHEFIVIGQGALGLRGELDHLGQLGDMGDHRKRQQKGCA
jgi:hypothetical protein